MRARTLTLLLTMLLVAPLLSVPSASAGACHLTATQIDFGQFNPLNGTALQAVGYIAYRCSMSIANVRIALSAGQSNNPAQRSLTPPGASPTFPYLLTLDPARTQIWGDGFSTTVVYSVPTAPANTPIQIPVYGYLPPGPVPALGRHTDTITVQLSWN
jgi:spore coat protein U-like protein